KIARSLGMTALVEVHTLHELDRVLTLEGVEWVGINNRDLQTFQVDLHTTIHLLSERRSQLQQRRIGIVSESGILNSWDLQQVGHAGVQAVLVGESLMRQPDPGQGIRHLVTTPTVNRYNR
ncbi:MAG: indole-3-glycerol-phosphate synthase TrpC, partial [Synechococcales cyanobacterium]